jgi:hypothetical protein
VKKSILRALGFTVILWGVGVFAVNNQGVASCVPEIGFSGFMQKALFVSSGNCIIKSTSSKSCNAPGATCLVNSALSAGKGNTGKCTQGATCVCVALNGN